MKTRNRVVKSVFGIVTTAAVFTVCGMTQIAIGEEEVFSAESQMCYVDWSDPYVIQKGKAQTVTGNLKYFWRIRSDTPLMNGWQTNVEEHSLHKSGKEKIKGELIMLPDAVEDGYFAETYSFKAGDQITGTYIGFGELNDVTVHYEVEFTGGAGFCAEGAPDGCDLEDGCEKIPGPIVTLTGKIVDECPE